MSDMATPLDSLPLGIVVERRAIDNPWQDHEWRPVAVIPGAPPADGWRELQHGDGWVHYHAGTLDLELYRRETDGYKSNLQQHPPRVYVVLRPGDDVDDHEVEPFLVTVCPNEAHDYVESGDEIVEGVAMPDEIAVWLQEFVDRHHVEQPFKKRKRKAYDPNAGDFQRAPPGDDDRG